MAKLIDADKLRERVNEGKKQITSADGYYGVGYDTALDYVVELIDAAPDLSLTWKDVRQLVRTADSIITRETGKYRDEQAYYEEVLRRFNAAQE